MGTEARHQEAAVRRTWSGWFHRQVRRLCLAAILAVAGLAGAWSMIVDRVDQEIRRLVESKFGEHYAGMHVSVASARRIEGKGVEIRGLMIADLDSPRDPILHIDELFLSCDTDVSRMVTQGVHPHSITVGRAHLRATRDAQGEWDIQRLLPPPRFGPCCPQMLIRDAQLELVDRSGDQERVVTLREINLDLAPRITGSEACLASEQAPPLKVSGSLTCDHTDHVAINGDLNRESGEWRFHGRVRGLQIGPRWFAALPRDVAARLHELRALQGRASFEYRISSSQTPNSPISFQIAGALEAGQIDDTRLPHALRGVRAKFTVDNQRIAVRDFMARSDDTTYNLAFSRDGLDAGSPWRLHARIERLLLSDRFSHSLPASLKPLWEKFQPRGTVNASLALIFDGKQLYPSIEAECLDVSGTYDKFPYPLDHVSGVIRYEGNRVSSERLTANAGGSELEMSFRFDDPGPRHRGFFRFSTIGPITLDQRLMFALQTASPTGQKIVSSFKPTGRIRAQGYFEKATADGPLQKHLTVDILNGSVVYKKFPYPLHQLTGTLEMTNDRWEFRNLTAYNDSAYISCTGNWGPVPEGGVGLVLSFRGTDIPLEDELRDALQAGAKRIWLDLRPRGTLDHLAATVRYLPASKRLSVAVEVDKYQPAANVQGKSITVEPVWFPYRLNDVCGHVRYENGVVAMSRMQARHNRTRLALDGRCEFSPLGDWTVRLENINATHVNAENELLDALPQPMGAGLRKLHLSGPMSMKGSVSFAGQTAQPHPSSQWDLDLDMENGQIDCGLPLQNVRGGLTLAGVHDHRGLNCRGELSIDSLLYKGIHITWLRGPLAITDKGLMLGVYAAPQGASDPPRRLTAKVWGGAGSLDAFVAFQEDTPYRVNASLSRAKLAELARDLGSANRNLSGQAHVDLDLNGNAGGTYSWSGGGSIRLEEADIYELPLIIALLTPLRNHPLDRTAFDRSNIAYRIRGQHVYFDQIDFLGEALTLKGVGEMDLQRRIKLQFYTLVGRDDVFIPLLRPVLGEASRQILMIEMAGTLDNPKVTQKAFPKLNDALRQLFPETNRGRAGSPPDPATQTATAKRSSFFLPGVRTR